MRQGCLSLLMTLVLAATACSDAATEADPDAWVGSVTTEGDVTTVVNESGALWDGAATLVEEASIGVEVGDDAYMFGRIAGLYASDDEIFVVDEQKPAIRVYDYAGQHLRDIGAEGQGPGEFQRPRWVAQTEDGRVFTIAASRRRINVYGPAPGQVTDWPLGRMMCCIHNFAVTDDGVVWVETGIVNEERRQYDPGILAHGPDGPIGEPLMVPDYDYRRWTLTYDGRVIEAVPYAPEIVFAIAPAGLLVAGTSDRYRFEIISPEGPKTVVERQIDPALLIAEETSYAETIVRTRFARNEAGQQVSFSWDGRVPEHKPAFRFFLPTHDGDIWVLREGPAEPVEGCDPAEMTTTSLGTETPTRCFHVDWIVDVFDAEGRYLGEVDTQGVGMVSPTRTFIRGDTLVSETQDPNGTILVKRYRIRKPALR